jgi:hypothetical protein
MPVAFYNIILCGHIIFGMEAPPLGCARQRMTALAKRPIRGAV